MQLLLLRHASAEDAPAPGESDADRRLTDDGHDEARLAARAMAQMGLAPSLVLSSPYRRALETARPVAAMLDVEMVRERRLQPGFDPGAFAALAELHGAERSLLLVGHEPDLSGLVRYLTGARVAMRKSGLALVDVTTLRPGGCELRFLLRPDQMRLIATARVTA
jgi:phosphohistidine phosphatase